MPLIELVGLVSTNPISAIVGTMELDELSLTEFNSAIAKLKKLVDFLPVVPAPAIAELRVTDVQLMPEDSMEQSRGNFNSWLPARMIHDFVLGEPCREHDISIDMVLVV